MLTNNFKIAYLFIDILETIFKALIFIQTNADPIFIALWICVCLSLTAAAAITQQIYGVLNLGYLSIVIVLLWMYVLGINLIYLVYILAFVGAVLMLFLSIVLMLPASIIVPRGLSSILFLTVYQETNWEVLIKISFLAGVLTALLYMGYKLCYPYLQQQLYPTTPLAPHFKQFNDIFKANYGAYFILRKIPRLQPYLYNDKKAQIFAWSIGCYGLVVAWCLGALKDCEQYSVKAIGKLDIAFCNYINVEVYPYKGPHLIKIFPICYNNQMLCKGVQFLNHNQMPKIIARICYSLLMSCFVLLNLLIVIKKWIKTYNNIVMISLAKITTIFLQAYMVVTTFITACPGFYTARELNQVVYSAALKNHDGILAVKFVLYTEMPLLTIVSVLGLLVALLSTATTRSTKPPQIKEVYVVDKVPPIVKENKSTMDYNETSLQRGTQKAQYEQYLITAKRYN